MKAKCSLFYILLLYCFMFVAAQGTITTKTIPLNNAIIKENNQLYGGYVTLNGSSTLQVNFTDVNTNISFIILQAHSHIYEITMYNTTLARNMAVTGRNVGLISFAVPKLDTFYIQNSNVNVTLNISIAVHGYTDKDPVPGGCNMEFSVPIAPFLRTTVTKDYLTVEGTAASLGPKCDNQKEGEAEFYMMYLPEMNYDEDVYFNSINKMMTVSGIEKHGWWIPLQSSKWVMRRILSAYPGTGVVFAAVTSSTDDDNYAAYVPTVTYACTPVDGGGCEIIDDAFSQILCFVLMFVGIFLCYFGHRFFKTEMYLAGFFSGVIITYFLISTITIVDTPALLGASALSGFFFGAIWLLFWWLYGIPVIAVLLPSLQFGFLVSSILYYRFPANLLVMESDLNFWTMFILVMLLTALALVSVTFAANILCCSILGAYATVFSLDYYLGSNLKYIIINTIRRAVVPKFKNALLIPPFQWRDGLVTALWVILATTGYLFQHYHNRGRPPFPPPPRNTRLSVPEQRMYGTITTYGNRRPQATDTEQQRSNDERRPLLS